MTNEGTKCALCGATVSRNSTVGSVSEIAAELSDLASKLYDLLVGPPKPVAPHTDSRQVDSRQIAELHSSTVKLAERVSHLNTADAQLRASLNRELVATYLAAREAESSLIPER